MRLIKQNDTSKPLAFLLVSSSDHISGVLGATPVVTISKNGASFATPTGTVSEIGNGWYKLIPSPEDVATLGPLLLHATASGADPVDLEFRVVAFNPDSSTNLGLSALPIASPGVEGGMPTVDANNHIAGVAGLDASKLDVAVSSRSNHAPADIWSVPDRTITGGSIDTNNDKIGYGLSAKAIDDIWNEPRSEHTIPGTFGAVSEWAGGGSGSVQVIVQPLTTTVQQVAGDGGVITGWRYAKLRASWWITDSNLTGHDLRVILYTDDGKVTKIQEYSTGAGEITITYQAPNTLIQLTGTDAKTPNPGRYRYVLRNQSTDAVLLAGICKIYDAPDAS